MQNEKKTTDNCQKCEDAIKDPPMRKAGKFRISLFFDGTGNNRDNTEFCKNDAENKLDEKKLKRLKDIIHPLTGEGTFDEVGSFSNDYTNIYRLEELTSQVQPQYDFSASIYIEGIGTKDNSGIRFNTKGELVKDGVTEGLAGYEFWQSDYKKIKREIKVSKFKDDFEGMSKGQGSTGVKEKSKKGVSELIIKIANNLKSFDTIDLEIDVFGFSRGAAAARYFIYLIKRDNQLSCLNSIIKSIDINFVGLFDTVPAYGSDTSLFDWTTDVTELHQNVFNDIDVVGKVVHLCAAEEYRDAFKLVNIKSAIEKGYGIEVYLPGAHADIGGGYYDNSIEGKKDERYQLLDLFEFYFSDDDEKVLTDDRERFINLGWYNLSEFQIDKKFRNLSVVRKGIRNSYAYIPLDIMQYFAKKSGVSFNKDATEAYPISGDKLLTRIKTLLKSHALQASILNNSTLAKWEERVTDDHKKLRHDYLHFSARFNEETGKEVYKPRIIDGVRTRGFSNG